MDLPTEYRAHMISAAVGALSEELRDLQLPALSANRIACIIEQIEMNAQALFPEMGPTPCLSQPSASGGSIELPKSNVIPLRRPA
ncbi:hypothetical protein [Rhizobium sp. PP-F2F-G48]|uniref:hypothetical protein n=1 Tax=Rhizobium sp. PP-F2F-G48 TaxID=2135651 RepID=UPI0010438941|nr:hypothetical protein [Rhizobium sp. PP-F2F-G48]